jgi:hypothetical protein
MTGTVARLFSAARAVYPQQAHPALAVLVLAVVAVVVVLKHPAGEAVVAVRSPAVHLVMAMVVVATMARQCCPPLPLPVAAVAAVHRRLVAAAAAAMVAMTAGVPLNCWRITATRGDGDDTTTTLC